MVRAAVLSTFPLVGGHFAAYTFVSPVLRTAGGIGEGAIGPLLLDVVSILGNFLAVAASQRNVRATHLTINGAWTSGRHGSTSVAPPHTDRPTRSEV